MANQDYNQDYNDFYGYDEDTNPIVKNTSGYYAPKLQEGKPTYEATLRFLHNRKDGAKHNYITMKYCYVKTPNGNFGFNIDYNDKLQKTFSKWYWDNRKKYGIPKGQKSAINPTLWDELSNAVTMSTRHYSLVYVKSDENAPEAQDTVQVFRYNNTILELIKNESTRKVMKKSRPFESNNSFNPNKSRDFTLYIKKGDYGSNYDDCEFDGDVGRFEAPIPKDEFFEMYREASKKLNEMEVTTLDAEQVSMLQQLMRTFGKTNDIIDEDDDDIVNIAASTTKVHIPTRNTQVDSTEVEDTGDMSDADLEDLMADI